MIRAVIVDDEELARRGARALLASAPDVEIVAECSNGREALKAIRTHLPDLLLLDVQMPGLSGLDVIDAIGQESCPIVVFVTAHSEHAVRAFDANAVDYVLKPIDEARFNRALERVRAQLAQRDNAALRERLRQIVYTLNGGSALEGSGLRQRLVVRSGARDVYIDIEEIDWASAAGDYVTLHVGSKTWLMRATFATVAQQLASHGFVRIHRSFLVNADRISELEHLDSGDSRVRLRDGTVLRMSRTYRDALQM